MKLDVDFAEVTVDPEDVNNYMLSMSSYSMPLIGSTVAVIHVEGETL